MSAKSIIPMAIGAVGMALGQEYLAPLLLGGMGGAAAGGAAAGAAEGALAGGAAGAGVDFGLGSIAADELAGLTPNGAGLAGSIATSVNESPFLSTITGGPLTTQGVAKWAGRGIGGLGGSFLGSQLAKGFDSGDGSPIAHPGGMASFPNSRGVTAPQFQFQTVGVQPQATIGGRKKDILDLLRTYQRTQGA